jgi:hypothetical protein
MKNSIIATLLGAALVCTALAITASARTDDFDAVVKVIEQHYHVKHKGIPFLARAGMKTATAAARLAGGQKRRLAEAGSVKVAYFEDQDFVSVAGASDFRRNLKAALLPEWLPFVQVLAPNDEEQTYVFLREASSKFNLLVVNIDKHEGSVVQVDVSPQTLALLLQNPNEIGKAITDDATTNDY